MRVSNAPVNTYLIVCALVLIRIHVCSCPPRYAWSNYLRMEEIILATIQLQSTRSMLAYTEDIMIILKDCIRRRNGELMEYGNYWVTRFNKRFLLIKELQSRLSRLGDGLCKRIIDLLERMTTNGEPNIKVEAVDGNEYVVIHKVWIAQVLTPVEAAIIQVLRRNVSLGVNVQRDYASESLYVFTTALRRSLRSPDSDGAIKHTELERYSSHDVVNGLRHLQNRHIDGKPMIMLPDTIPIAEYTPTCIPTSERAKDNIRWKTSRMYDMPIVVNERLLALNLNIVDMSPVDRFFKDMLIISGGYIGMRIFSGIDHANPGRDIRDNNFYVRADDKASFEVHNPHYQSRADTRILFGTDSDSEDEMDEDGEKPPPSIFPSNVERLKFNEKSNIEGRVADLAHYRVPLEPEIEEVFKTAYTKFI